MQDFKKKNVSIEHKKNIRSDNLFVSINDYYFKEKDTMVKKIYFEIKYRNIWTFCYLIHYLEKKQFFKQILE